MGTSPIRLPEASSLLQPVLAEAIRISLYERGNIQLLDSQALSIVCHRGFDKSFLDAFERVGIDTECACGRALKAKEAVFIGDVERDERYAPYLPAAHQAGYRSVLSLPILDEQDNVLGVISVHDSTPQSLPPPDISHLGDFAAALIVRQSLLESR